MIDVENELFTDVAKLLREEFPGIYVTGEAVPVPPKFPCVSFYEDDNYVSQADLDSSGEEKFAVLRYRVDIYSNLQSGKKQQCKQIAQVIQPYLYILNFTRFSHTPLSDMGDRIYHLVETYRVKTDGESFYRV